MTDQCDDGIEIPYDRRSLYDLAVITRDLVHGVVVTDDQGRPFDSFAGLDRQGQGPTLLAAGPQLHPQVLATIRRRS